MDLCLVESGGTRDEGARRGLREKQRFVHESPETRCKCMCVCMCVFSGVKVHDLYQIPWTLTARGTETLGYQWRRQRAGDGVGLGWGWGRDGVCRGGAGRKEPGDARRQGVTAGRPACHAKEHGLHSKAIGAYCLGRVSDLPLAWVTEL